MPVKWLIALLLVFPILLYASQEEDMELFEFLAMYDQDDNAFIDSEMDERIETSNTSMEDSLTTQEVMMSEPDEQ